MYLIEIYGAEPFSISHSLCRSTLGRLTKRFKFTTGKADTCANSSDVSTISLNILRLNATGV